MASRLERWFRPMQKRLGMVLLVVSMAATTVLLYTLPMVWVSRKTSLMTNQYQDAHWTQFQEVYRHWMSFETPPAFHRGDEPAVKAYLGRHPLLVGLADRRGPLWIREGDHLVPAKHRPEDRLQSSWVEAARRSGRSFHAVPPADHPEHLQGPAMVLLGEPFSMVKRWRVGSPEVEAMIGMVQQGKRPLRLGLRRVKNEERHEGEPAAWSNPGTLQVDYPRDFDSPWTTVGNDEAFGDGWELAALPGQEDLAALMATIRRETRFAQGVYIILAVALSLGLYLRYRSRQRDKLDSDRLASMAHSLKTPLTVLKLRCDSLRLGGLPPETAEAQFLRIGEEVDELVGIIENGLLAMKRIHSPSPKSKVDQSFYEKVRKDLSEAFDLEGRVLRLDYVARDHYAHLPSLRSALVTLLENGLAYGSGQVDMVVLRMGAQTIVQVWDHGPGLPSEEHLRRLGTPFQRFREGEAQGFRREGQGLGLSLLVQMAQQEGWGLEFRNHPGKGFEVLLELPA